MCRSSNGIVPNSDASVRVTPVHLDGKGWKGVNCTPLRVTGSSPVRRYDALFEKVCSTGLVILRKELEHVPLAREYHPFDQRLLKQVRKTLLGRINLGMKGFEVI